MQDIDRDILIKASEGDLKAFETIYKVTSGFVYNVAYRIVHNRQDAEEVTQEVFLNIYRKLKYFRFEASFNTWVYRITTNCAINQYKKISKDNNRKQEFYEYLNPWPALDKSFLANESDKEIVNLFLRMLNPDQRMCIVLRSIEGLSYRQIADILKISINTVRSRIKRAREKLLAGRREVAEHEL